MMVYVQNTELPSGTEKQQSEKFMFKAKKPLELEPEDFKQLAKQTPLDESPFDLNFPMEIKEQHFSE